MNKRIDLFTIFFGPQPVACSWAGRVYYIRIPPTLFYLLRVLHYVRDLTWPPIMYYFQINNVCSFVNEKLIKKNDVSLSTDDKGRRSNGSVKLKKCDFSSNRRQGQRNVRTGCKCGTLLRTVNGSAGRALAGCFWITTDDETSDGRAVFSNISIRVRCRSAVRFRRESIYFSRSVIDRRDRHI